MDEALVRLEELLASEDDAVAVRAVREVFDRVLGRPRQPLQHSGSVGFEVDLTVGRAKLNEFLERRAQQIASERGA